jgi:hypothetical protein
MVAIAILLGYPGSPQAVEAIIKMAQAKRVLLGLSQRHLLNAYPYDSERRYRAHAILQAFYYELPSHRKRQELHRQAGEYYEREEADPLLAARHFQLAGHP